MAIEIENLMKKLMIAKQQPVLPPVSLWNTLDEEFHSLQLLFEDAKLKQMQAANAGAATGDGIKQEPKADAEVMELIKAKTQTINQILLQISLTGTHYVVDNDH